MVVGEDISVAVLGSVVRHEGRLLGVIQTNLCHSLCESWTCNIVSANQRRVGLGKARLMVRTTVLHRQFFCPVSYRDLKSSLCQCKLKQTCPHLIFVGKFISGVILHFLRIGHKVSDVYLLAV